LGDTGVFDRGYSSSWECNGYAFHNADAPGLKSALSRAIGLWYSYPQEYQELQLNGMRADHSWAWPSQDYLNIYEHICHR
jgi:starch synthase